MVNTFGGYAGSLWGTNYAVMGLATATNIEGPWTDQGMVTDVNYTIDPNVDCGPDGRLYISWGSWTGSGTYMHVLDQTTAKLSTTDNNLWHIAVGIENPTIILNGGYYYLFGSKGLCCSGTNSTYYTVVGRSTSITGPYLDQNGTDMASGGGTTVLTGAYPKVAAGGADAYDEGTSKFLAYHYYDGNNSGQETLDPAAYVALVTGEMLDACAPHARWIDVFCEKGAFDGDQARAILTAGKARGLHPRIHANQLSYGPGVQLAVELDAASADHCTHLTDADVDASTRPVGRSSR